MCVVQDNQFVTVEQFWGCTFPLCHEELVSCESYHVPLQLPPPFCFNFLTPGLTKDWLWSWEIPWQSSNEPTVEPVCVCVCVWVSVWCTWSQWCSILRTHGVGVRYRVRHALYSSKHSHENEYIANIHESEGEQEKENILFFPYNQRLCKHTHTGRLLSEAFPRRCGTKLHTRMGG